MVDSRQLDAIRAKAEVLSGGTLGPEGGAWVEMAAERAMACCCRENIPPEMEQAVAELAVSMSGGGAVKALTRGDTSITYAEADPLALLAPWRRLGRLRKDGRT